MICVLTHYHQVITLPDGDYPSITLFKTANNVCCRLEKDKKRRRGSSHFKRSYRSRHFIHEYAERHFNNEDIINDLVQESSDVIQMTRDLVKITESGVEEILVKSKFYGVININTLVGVIW